ncbi:MAG: hypothetical protein AB7Q37_05725 [Pyrinomonadaceae bacterium]
MNYPNGKKIIVDDIVMFEDIESPGKITHIVESRDDIAAWSCAKEPGVFIECEEIGWIYMPEQLFSDSRLRPCAK